MIGEQVQNLIRNRADPGLDRGRIGDSLDHQLGDPAVGLGRFARRHLDQRVVGFAPARDLADVDLVLAERPRELRVGLEEERHLADQRRVYSACGPSEK